MRPSWTRANCCPSGCLAGRLRAGQPPGGRERAGDRPPPPCRAGPARVRAADGWLQPQQGRPRTDDLDDENALPLEAWPAMGMELPR
ncbi:hypothetical protein G6F40_017572 [Rhizopus arrhizus]|nr:hypothetical protein G6F40_017572 [Rhizopus arrhizus]